MLLGKIKSDGDPTDLGAGVNTCTIESNCGHHFRLFVDVAHRYGPSSSLVRRLTDIRQKTPDFFQNGRDNGSLLVRGSSPIGRRMILPNDASGVRTMESVNGQANGAKAKPTKATPAPGQLVVTKADLAAARAQYKKQRREDMAGWMPSESTSYREMSLELRYGPAVMVFHMGLVHAQVSLYKFYKALPEHADAVKAAETTIEKKFNLIEGALDKRTAQLNAVSQAVAADEVSGVTEPKTFTVRMLTREAMRFADLLKKYDAVIGLCHRLYWADKMNQSTVNSITFEFRNLLMTFTREIHNLYTNAKSSVRNQKLAKEKARILKEKRKAFTAKAERDQRMRDEADHVQSHAMDVASDTPDPTVEVASAAAPKKRARKTNGAAEAVPA
jgi:alkylhydroperoxidase/carboxymuconolactone decarboxylase family protein YurZ